MNAKKKILIIDDDLNFVKAVELSLLKKGYEVDTAQVGEIGLNKLNKNKPDLVILDIMMPGMNGFQVCDRIKDNPANKDVKIVVLSGIDINEGFEKAMAKKVDWYIVKPFDLNYLFKILDMLFNKKKNIKPEDIK